VSYVFNNLNAIKESLKQSPFGLITDLDGTISWIAPTHKQAVVSPLCLQYLSELRDTLPLVAVISGRAVAIVRKMVDIDGIVYIGNHGMERWSNNRTEYSSKAENYMKLIQIAVKRLDPVISATGVYIENKNVSATLHYRLSPQPETTREKALNLLQESPQLKSLRIVPGRMVIDVLPPIEINKGTAVLELIREYKLKGGIYLGDDLTDIDAFKTIHSTSLTSDFHGINVGIISQEMPEQLLKEVDFTLNSVADVEEFLKWLSLTARQLNG
jgi:trehalose 6-phosphate phosphatase